MSDREKYLKKVSDFLGENIKFRDDDIKYYLFNIFNKCDISQSVFIVEQHIFFKCGYRLFFEITLNSRGNIYRYDYADVFRTFLFEHQNLQTKVSFENMFKKSMTEYLKLKGIAQENERISVVPIYTIS